jgi:iron complex outermembrane receptor protein
MNNAKTTQNVLIKTKTGLFLTSAACALISAGAAFAQTTPSAAPAAAPDNASTIQEVVVTAERRSVSQQTTSISMSVVSGNVLAANHIVTIQDLQNLAPGMSFTASNPTSNINIRGLGNTAISPAVTTGVAVFRDGLYEPEAILLSEPFYDIADVEVLKGPQGTIVGQNSTGGALTINSKNPDFNGFGGNIEAQGGNYHEAKLDGAVNLPISSTLAARVAFNLERRDSFWTDIGGQQAQGSGSGAAGSNVNPGMVDEQNVRIGLLWKPTDKFQLLAKAEINYLSTGGYTARPLPWSPYYSYGYNGPSVYNNNRALGKWDLDYNETALSDNQYAGRYSVEMKYNLPGGLTLRSLTGFQETNENYNTDTDWSAANTGVAGARHQYHLIGPEDNYYSQELDILSPDTGRITYLAGASYFYRQTAVHDRTYNGAGVVAPIIGASGNPANPYTFTCPAGQTCNLFSISSTLSTQQLLGVFGQVDFKILDNLHLVVGGRESFDTNNNYGYTETGNLTSYIPNLGHYSRSEPTYKVTLNWEPMPGQFLYAFAARGYKQGGINNSASQFAPEFVNDYEGGWKGRFFENHLQTQLGGYYMQYQGMQQSTLSPITGTNLVTNLGNSTIYGVEGSFQARFGGWNWDAAVAYNQSTLGAVNAVATYLLAGNGATAFPTCPAGSAVASGASGTVNGVSCTNYTGTVISLSGEKNPYSPTVQFNTDLTYTFEMGKGTLTPRVSYAYTDSQYATIFQKIPTGINANAGKDGNGNSLPYPNYLIPSHGLVDLALTYKFDLWTAEVYGKNVTNLYYLSGINGNNGFYGDPATYGVRVARSF